ncbi:hypothetical protein Ae201684P_018965 [Aphanomyces euteiches]|nr:hypothetical protein Ae201684P_018965 [Aphanomyces euteiches]
MPLATLSCSKDMRDALKLQFSQAHRRNTLEDDSTQPSKSRFMRKLENVQATLGREVVVTRQTLANTLPKLNKCNGAEIVIPNRGRSCTAPLPFQSPSLI